MSTYSNFFSFNWDFEFHLENAVPVSIKAEEKLFRFDYIKILNVCMSDCQKNKIFWHGTDMENILVCEQNKYSIMLKHSYES